MLGPHTTIVARNCHLHASQPRDRSVSGALTIAAAGEGVATVTARNVVIVADNVTAVAHARENVVVAALVGVAASGMHGGAVVNVTNTSLVAIDSHLTDVCAQEERIRIV